MKLRFKVDQAECLRRGIDCPKSIVSIEVNPSKLPQDQRDMIAAHMDGIDVCKLDGVGKPMLDNTSSPWRPVHVVATEPTFQGLIDAIHRDATDQDARMKKADTVITKLQELRSLVEGQASSETVAAKIRDLREGK